MGIDKMAAEDEQVIISFFRSNRAGRLYDEF